MTLTKVQELAKINEFLQIAAAIPIIAQRINWDGLIRKVVEAYGWSPDEVLLKQPIPMPAAVPAEGGAAAPEIPSELAAMLSGSTIMEGAMPELEGMSPEVPELGGEE